MKVAIVHDWLVTNAGAEKVLKEIVAIYPDADIFSLVDFLSDIQREEVIAGKKVTTSFLQYFPFAKTHFRNFLPFFPKAIESLDLSVYDLVISSSWAVAKGVKTSNVQIHICYCHTPIRYAWDLYDEYVSSLKQPKKALVEQTLKYIRKWDLKSLDRVDHFIANSNFVKERINRLYNRNAEVIYPPVDTNKFILCTEKEDFYLTASRLVSYKKTKLIVEAFNEMPEKKLVVIGVGEDYDAIVKIAKENIVVMGYQDDIVLVDMMAKAKAFVYAAVEDFGIVPVEAMVCGTPVIALNDGGTAETVVDGFSGVHFQRQSVEDIVDAVNRFEGLTFNLSTIAKEAHKYASKRFTEEMKSFVVSKLKKGTMAE